MATAADASTLDYEATQASIDRILRDADNSFDSIVVAASLAAMSGSTMITNILKRYPCPYEELPGTQKALVDYCSGCAALNLSGTDYNTANDKFQDALANDRYFALAHCGLAVVHYKRKDYRQAFSEFKVALEQLGDLCPNVVRVGLGLCAFYVKRFDHAALCLKRALEVDKDDTLAKLALFTVHMQQRQVQEAAALITEIQANMPSPVVLQRFADVVFFKAVGSNSVVAQCDVLLKLIRCGRAAPEQKEPRTARHLRAYSLFQEARVFQAVGRTGEAKQLYRQALELNDALLCAKVHLLQIIASESHGPLALQFAWDLRRALPHDDETLRLTATLLTENELHDAAAQVSQLLTDAVASADPASWAIAAWASRLDARRFTVLLEKAKDVSSSQATKRFDVTNEANLAAIKADRVSLAQLCKDQFHVDVGAPDVAGRHPSLPREAIPAVFNYALISEASDTVQARELYLWLAKIHPQVGSSYMRLAALARVAGNVEESLGWMSLLLRLNLSPEDSECAVVGIADVLASAGHLKPALETLKRGAERLGKQAAIAITQGSLYLRDSGVERGVSTGKVNRGKVEAAADRFGAAIDRDEGNVFAVHGLACCRASCGDADGALKLFKRVAEIATTTEAAKLRVRDHIFTTLVHSDLHKQALDEIGPDPKDPQQLFAQARCYAELDDFLSAQNALAKCEPSQEQAYNRALVMCAEIIHILKDEPELSPEAAAVLTSKLKEVQNISFELTSSKRAERLRRIIEAEYRLEERIVLCLKRFVSSEAAAREKRLAAAGAKRPRDEMTSREADTAFDARSGVPPSGLAGTLVV